MVHLKVMRHDIIIMHCPCNLAAFSALSATNHAALFSVICWVVLLIFTVDVVFLLELEDELELPLDPLLELLLDLVEIR